MSDRMLSDEILLGIINSKSGGGGGGGTDDYNKLKNQPQINNNTLIGNMTASDLGLVAAEAGKGLSTNDYTNADKAIVGGVTAALADKADKSAVKNEFIGKTAEWNALTTAQKKAYDTYQITDDYTEGSGLPDYSTTEQLTGQKWIDGKDIYFRTYNNIQLTNNTPVVVDANFGSTNNIIDMRAILDGISSGGSRYQYIANTYNEGGSYSVFIEVNGDTLQIVVRGNWTNYKASLVIYYTKA